MQITALPMIPGTAIWKVINPMHTAKALQNFEAPINQHFENVQLWKLLKMFKTRELARNFKALLIIRQLAYYSRWLWTRWHYWGGSRVSFKESHPGLRWLVSRQVALDFTLQLWCVQRVTINLCCTRDRGWFGRTIRHEFKHHTHCTN